MAKLKLNDKLQEEICNEIKAGTPMKHAAITHGISETTFYDWWNKGKDAKTGKFRNFYLAVEEAKSAAITLKSRLIHKASKNNWQAAAWWLERVDPDNFGRKETRNIKAEVEMELAGKENIYEYTQEEMERIQNLTNDTEDFTDQL